MFKLLSKSLCLRAVLATLTVSLSVGLQAQTAATAIGFGSGFSANAPVVSSGGGAVPAAAVVPGVPAAAGAPVLPALPDAKPVAMGSGEGTKIDTKADLKVDAKVESKLEGKEPPTAEAIKDPNSDETEFQRFVYRATGQALRLFGFELFGRSNSFSPVQAAPVPAGYILGPGDELVVQVNGLVEVNERLVIDRDGRVMVPKVGPLNLAGVALSDIEKVFSAHIGKVYRNFTVSVTMGRLRSIEVFVVGQARRPGKHLVSSLSSLINALFETGGPNSNGTLRAIELRRGGKKIATVDMYAFLAQGDNSADVQLLAGDIIFIPPAGARAALLGTINAPAIYELRANETINQILNMSGGLPTLAAPQKAQLERVDANREIARYVEDFALDAKGLGLALQAGDILTVFQISPQIANVVTLEGNVAAPMRHTFKPGMKVSDLLSDPRLLIPGSYWQQLNQASQTGNYSRAEVNLHYATIQRLDAINLRTSILAFNLVKAVAKDPQENLLLQSGDIVTVYKPGQSGPESENSISVITDFVGGTQRFVWRPGFTIQNIIPSIQWLSDWKQLNLGTNISNIDRGEVNLDYATILSLDAARLRSRPVAFNLAKAVAKDPQENLLLQAGDIVSVYSRGQAGADTQDSITITGKIVGGSRRFVWRPGFTIKDIIPSAQWLIDYYNYWQRPSGGNLKNDINWDYAQVIRRMPATLETRAITFSLGDAVLRNQPESNLVLQPGDQITLFTTQQLAVPINKQTRLVTVSGEVGVPGIYQVAPGETLAQLIQRAGGFTAQSYLYGIEFKRESNRVSQQDNLNRIVQRIETQVDSDTQTRLQNITNPEQAQTVQASVQADQIRLANLRKLRATGRIALGLDPLAPQLPHLALEDGDTLHVPNTPAFVGAFGAVLNENAILWKEGNRVQDIVRQAGLTTYADESELYLMRADGTVQRGRNSSSLFGLISNTSSTLMMPGDTVVVPEKANRETGYTAFMRSLKDWTLVLSQFGLGAAAIKILRN